MFPSFLLFASALSGFLAVALGAFGSHALKNRLDSYSLGVWETANEYHFYNTLSLLVVVLAIEIFPEIKLFKVSAYFFLLGMIIFSASLYALALSGVKLLGAVTPIGGLCLLTAWLLLAIAALKI